MDMTRELFQRCFSIPWLGLAIGLLLFPSPGDAQVRTKKPDRGVYQSPRLPKAAVEPASQDESQSGGTAIADLVRDHPPAEAPKPKRRELVEVTVEVEGEPTEVSHAAPRAETPIANDDEPVLRTAGHEDVILVEPSPPHVIGEGEVIYPGDTWMDDGTNWGDGRILHDDTCDGCSMCDGCDAMGCCMVPWYHRAANASLCFEPDRWFGSVELLLMFRKGDRLPPLVTTGSSANPDTAGQLGQAGTRVLAGGENTLNGMTAGGRLTVGTWIDNQQCRSLVLRGWFAGQENDGFFADQSQFPVLARPFFNVSDNQTSEQDAFLIAFPNRATGAVSVRASSDIFGADLSVRQYWYGEVGGTVDLLYGYQYMRMNEELNISSTSTSLDNDFAPIGSVISVADSFDIANEFNGGQIGIASRYRERCWSFNGLAKVGFGSLRRRARLDGSTFTSIDGANAVDPNGLLVRSTNSGTVTDHTFGWVPELDLSLGWHRYPRFDVTVGYHIVAMTDALQVSNAIDPNLAVNLSDQPTGQQRPELLLRYDTFYVQGIHFGLQYTY